MKKAMDKLASRPAISGVAALICIAMLFIGQSAHAAIRTVYSFETPEGATPMAGLVIGNDGNFYGTAAEGGAASKGSIFKVTPSGQVTTLHSFQGLDGESPRSSLTKGNDGNLYGVTFIGGANGYGVVFRITPSGQFTVLHSLTDSQGGVAPLGALAIGSDGNFYGTTSSGGFAGGGLYKISPAGVFQGLRSLSLTDGIIPKAGLLLASDGNFYGVTSSGGGNNPLMSSAGGTIFKLTPSGQFSVLYVFDPSLTGVNSSASLIEGSDGNLYGTAAGGGASNGGTLFKLSKAGVLTVLHSFENDTGISPVAALVEGESGVFYGTTSAGGQPNGGNASLYGTVFKITSTGQYQVLHRFTGSDGGVPLGALVRAADGKFYGTTAGFIDEPGTIFRISSDGTFATITEFGHPNGSAPVGSLDQDASGRLVGVTSTGGATSAGLIFSVSLQGQFNVRHSFGENEGRAPLDGVTLGPDGAYYGTTSTGGQNGYGTIYKLSDAGSLTVLHSFNSLDGARPEAPLVVGSDNALYGSTVIGGTGNGTLFRVTPSGSFTTLHVFNEADGALPSGRLVQGVDGALYGATAAGGLGYGTLFKITSSGAHTKLYSFPGDDSGFFPNGAFPLGGLTIAQDGNFYGTTNQNTVFRLTPQGAFTSLRKLVDSQGVDLRSSLLLGSDGNLYGTARFGGTIVPGTLESFGTLFRITLDGTVTVLHVFSGSDGKEPEASLLQASNGNFYGIASRGGSGGAGTIFEVPGPPLIPSGVVLTPRDGQIDVSWRAAGGAQTYNVFIRTSSQSNVQTPVLTGVSSTQATVRGLTNGETYYCSIVSVNAVGQSLKSSEASATPMRATAPGNSGSGGGGAFSPVLSLLLVMAAIWRRLKNEQVNRHKLASR